EDDFWLGRQFETALMDDLRIGFTNRRFDHLGHGRFAVQPLEMGGRYLAGAKAAKLHAAFDIVEPSINLGFQIGGGDDDTKCAFSPRCSGFSPSHRHYSSGPIWRTKIHRRFRPTRPGAGEPARLVRAEGLEPPRLSSRDSKPRASTNSATPATCRAARRRGLYHLSSAGHHKIGRVSAKQGSIDAWQLFG